MDAYQLEQINQLNQRKNNMTTLEKFEELANIKFVENARFAELELGDLQTADGYNLFYMTTDIQNLQFDSEVYYYRPEFDAVIKMIDDLKYHQDEPLEIACYDIDEWFDEYYMLDYIQDNMDEDEFEEFTK